MSDNVLVNSGFEEWREYIKYDDLDFYSYKDNFKVYGDIKSELIFGDLSMPVPKYTIFIPTFKRPDLLQETIDSALNQKKFKDYEIIILDNDPERNTPTEKILKKKYSKYKNVFYYKQEKWNPGNCNRGIELSRTEWFTIVCDDDLLLPNFLHSADAILNKFPEIEALSCAFNHFKYDYLKRKVVSPYKESFLGKIRQKIKAFTDKYCAIFPAIIGENYLDHYYIKKAAFPEIGMIYKRKNVIDIGGWDTSFAGCDLAFNVKYLDKYNMYYTTEILAKKRDGIGNCSSLKSIQLDFIFVEYLLFRTFKNKLKYLGFDEKYLKSLVMNRLQDLELLSFEDINIPIKGEFLFDKKDNNPEFLEYFHLKMDEYTKILNEKIKPIKTYANLFQSKQNGFQNKLDNIAKKYKNKKVILYGTGKVCDLILRNFDISKINIVAVSDRKYTDETQIYEGFKTIPPEKIAENKPDIVLITLQDYLIAGDYFEDKLFKNGQKFKYKSIFVYSLGEFCIEWLKNKMGFLK